MRKKILKYFDFPFFTCHFSFVIAESGLIGDVKNSADRQ